MPVLEVSGAISKLYANNSNPYRRTSLMSATARGCASALGLRRRS